MDYCAYLEFRKYTIALADEETAAAAEIYANNFESTEFMLMTKAFHALLDGFRDGIASGQDIDNEFLSDI